METYKSYQKLKKPSWAPPTWLFGPVWTVLYILIAIAFGHILLMVLSKSTSAIILVPIVLNLIFNFSFTPLQFGLKNNFLALIDVFLILATLIWAIVWIEPVSHLAFYLLLPYLIWVLIATSLQISVTYLNRK
jgi:tryptophan-rich sensory protein